MHDNLHLIVSEQLPEYVRANYPTFVEFVKAYYKWLSEQSVGRIEEVVDIDQTPQQFVQYFKNQLDVLNLGVGELFSGNTRYLKNIKEFYTAKGGEQALVFLLKNLYNTDAAISYPNQNILRASDGKWRQERFITVNGVFGTQPTSFTNVYLVVGEATVRVPITRVEYPATGLVRLYYETSPTVSTNQLVEVIVDNVVTWAGRVIDAPSYVEVANGGANWQLGQIVIFSGTVKNTVARVSDLTDGGVIRRVEILEFGWVHTTNQTLTVKPATDSPSSDEATLILRSAPSAKIPGRWADASGQISNQDIRIEDSFYYQQFSYDIETDANPSQYIGLVNAVHPAGSKIFTTYALQKSITVVPSAFTVYPFKSLGLFDIISVAGPTDEITKRTMVKWFNDTSTPTGEVAIVSDDKSLVLTKYNTPINDTVTATTGDTPSLSAIVSYTSDTTDYFAVMSGSDAYVGGERTLTLS